MVNTLYYIYYPPPPPLDSIFYSQENKCKKCNKVPEGICPLSDTSLMHMLRHPQYPHRKDFLIYTHLNR